MKRELCAREPVSRLARREVEHEDELNLEHSLDSISELMHGFKKIKIMELSTKGLTPPPLIG